jgi:nitroreductase
MKVSEAAARRRSVRRFKDKHVPFKVLEKCVDAARLAPSGRNRQVCEYIAINDASILPGVLENIGGSIRKPPEEGGPRPGQAARAYIIILINRNFEGDIKRGRMTYYDVGMAAENIMLVALEQGLGSCPIMLFDESALKPILEIPDHCDIALVIAMGYPDESPVAEEAIDSVDTRVDDKGVRHVPKRKLADIIHKNKF